MRIVIDARMLGWSGIGRYSQRLLEQLQKLDHQNDYVVLFNSADYDSWRPRRPNFQAVRSDWKPYGAGEQTGLLKQLYQLKPDLVHFLSFNAPLLYRGKSIVTIHDLTLLDWQNLQGSPLKKSASRLKRRSLNWVVKRLGKRASAIITPSLFVKRQLIKRFKIPAAKLHVTHEAADISKAKPKAVSAATGKDFLLYVGNAYPHKNLERLLAAWRQLSVRFPELWLVLAGRPDHFYQQLKTRVNQERLVRVVFAEEVNDRQLAWLYGHARALVFPSLSEGFGLPGLEAMQYGTAVVAARSSSLPEIYGSAASYFNPIDTSDMVRVISDVVDSPRRQQQLAERGRRRASRYSWQELAKQTLALYTQVSRK